MNASLKKDHASMFLEPSDILIICSKSQQLDTSFLNFSSFSVAKKSPIYLHNYFTMLLLRKNWDSSSTNITQ